LGNFVTGFPLASFVETGEPTTSGFL